MKKKFYGSNDVITVYKFMEMCGLKCNPKGNICVSHEIMMRKLNARNKKMNEKVIVPEIVPFHSIIKEEVKSGKTILVKDDNQIIEAYHIPEIEHVIEMSEEERMKIREKLIQEQLERIVENVMKPGYQKYLYRKSKKEEFEKTQTIEEQEYEVTEKKVRIMKLEKRKKQY